MKRIFLFAATTCVAFALASCQSNNKSKAPIDQEPEQAVLEYENDGGPADDAAVTAYVASIEKARPTLGIRGPVTVEFGKNILAEAQVFNAESGVPVLIYLQIRDVEQWYYLYNRRVVQFRERRPSSKGFSERQWNYTYAKALSGLEKNAPTPDGLDAEKGTSLSLDDAKTAESHGVVNLNVFEILYGKLPK